MQHNIVLPEKEFENIVNGKRHLIARDKGFFAEGDTLAVTQAGSRKQIKFGISQIENERMFKGWCVLTLGQEEMVITQETVISQPLPTFQDGRQKISSPELFPLGLGKTSTPIPADGRTIDAALPFTPEGFGAKDQANSANFATDL